MYMTQIFRWNMFWVCTYCSIRGTVKYQEILTFPIADFPWHRKIFVVSSVTGTRTNHSTSIQKVTHEKTPQIVYILLLIGTACLFGAQIFFHTKPKLSKVTHGKPWLKVSQPDPQGEFVPPHYVNNIRLFTKKVVKRFRMMYVNGQVLLQSGG